MFNISGLSAESILDIFERVASNLGQSVKLPRPLNRAGKPYGKANYHLASFDKEFSTKSLPLGYRWPSFEPNPNLDCDAPMCQMTAKSEIKRLTCGHTFHSACLGNNGCTICFSNLIKDIQKLSLAWNKRLMKKDEDEDEGHDDNDDDDPDEDDSTPLFKPRRSPTDYEYFDSKLFKQNIVYRSSKIRDIIIKSKQAHNE